MSPVVTGQVERVWFLFELPLSLSLSLYLWGFIALWPHDHPAMRWLIIHPKEKYLVVLQVFSCHCEALPAARITASCCALGAEAQRHPPHPHPHHHHHHQLCRGRHTNCRLLAAATHCWIFKLVRFFFCFVFYIPNWVDHRHYDQQHDRGKRNRYRDRYRDVFKPLN